jgi:exopolyphosphatase/guanosine-5'-triphosphate,3'-diphosphate pyrophosphatase
MRWALADEIYVPKIGLADGLIKMLYNELMLKSSQKQV